MILKSFRLIYSRLDIYIFLYLSIWIFSMSTLYRTDLQLLLVEQDTILQVSLLLNVGRVKSIKLYFEQREGKNMKCKQSCCSYKVA
jgi:hypothetical protein